MQNIIQKSRQSSIVFEKSDIWSENLKTLVSSNSSIFFAEISHMFSTYQCLQRDVWDSFLFHLDLKLLSKI